MTDFIASEQLTRKDFTSDQEVRWCPGCGDYAILATVQRFLPELGIRPENMVWVSGIGCSSRFPYYMNTYGFHTIHGRAPAFATGIKVSRPELSVWLATGDGDGLSIGGNHLMHILRRNVGVKILMFNNRIYGLTKGQYSPTSEFGKVTKSTPFGSADHPVDPASFALGCNATFVSRAIDTEAKLLTSVLRRAAEHQGTTFTEIYQNCNVFNDGAFDGFTSNEAKADAQLIVEHGKPLLFGKEMNRGIRLNPRTLSLEVVQVGGSAGEAQGVAGQCSVEEILVHDETNPVLANLLARMSYPAFPVALGVLFQTQRPTYESSTQHQIGLAIEKRGKGDLKALLNSGETWTV